MLIRLGPGAFLTRWAEGYDNDRISNAIGMSRRIVDRYMRFNKEQTAFAADGWKRLKLLTQELVTQE